MHPRVDTRPDGDADPSTRAIARKLRELPAELPPPFGWVELQRRARAHARPARHDGRLASGGRRALLVAAALASLVAAVALLSRLGGGRAEPIRSNADAAVVARAPVSPQSALRAGDADPLLQRAATAERWLAIAPDGSPIVRVSTRLAVTDLEDRIASVDDLINVEQVRDARPARVRALQLERAQLVDSLAQVRYAEMVAAQLP